MQAGACCPSVHQQFCRWFVTCCFMDLHTWDRWASSPRVLQRAPVFHELHPNKYNPISFEYRTSAPSPVSGSSNSFIILIIYKKYYPTPATVTCQHNKCDEPSIHFGVWFIAGKYSRSLCTVTEQCVHHCMQTLPNLVLIELGLRLAVRLWEIL